jgi:hypothetical protein
VLPVLRPDTVHRCPRRSEDHRRIVGPLPDRFLEVMAVIRRGKSAADLWRLVDSEQPLRTSDVLL